MIVENTSVYDKAKTLSVADFRKFFCAKLFRKKVLPEWKSV